MWKKSSQCDTNACVEVWQKSARCDANGNCLEVNWQKSSRCDNDLCLEARTHGTQVQVRNNREPGDVLSFGADDWRQFLTNLPVNHRS